MVGTLPYSGALQPVRGHPTEGNMAKWILNCPKCKSEFAHTQVSDLGMASLALTPQPEFAPTGNQCVCPNCGYSAIYFRTDLLYRP
jgi:predicted nucleic-acid-binding Zn-ribbon protein